MLITLRQRRILRQALREFLTRFLKRILTSSFCSILGGRLTRRRRSSRPCAYGGIHNCGIGSGLAPSRRRHMGYLLRFVIRGGVRLRWRSRMFVDGRDTLGLFFAVASVRWRSSEFMRVLLGKAPRGGGRRSRFRNCPGILRILHRISFSERILGQPLSILKLTAFSP